MLKRIRQKELKTVFIKAILAGICIAIGGAVFVSLMDKNKLLGAVLFSIGLITICTQNFNLFTGKACYLLDNDKYYFIDLIVIWFGNAIGTLIIAFFIFCTRLADSLQSSAKILVATKNADSLFSLFFLGVICNILIYIAVEGYKTNEHIFGKYLSIVFGVTVFILIGSEHSVADMFYYSLAGEFFRWDSLLRLIVISLGNVAGGLIIPWGKKLAAKNS